MPEMPEVEGLVEFLRARIGGLEIASARLAQIAALKTFDPRLDALVGSAVSGVERHGKFVDVAAGDLHLVFHLAKAGWLRWHDALPATVIKPGRSPIALRIGFADGSGFDLTEAGTKKSLAVYVVRDPAEVPGIARLGPDPLGDAFTRDTLAGLLAGRRTQIKGVLRDQQTVAGIGNAYSDEILHAAKLSPVAHAASLTDAERDRLYAAIRDILGGAFAARRDVPLDRQKAEKVAAMRVHGRTGEVCPVCGDEVRDVPASKGNAQYCATCQTGGVPLEG